MFAERVYTRDGLRFTGTGIEMNVQVNLFYQFAGHLRLGVAHGFSDNLAAIRVIVLDVWFDHERTQSTLRSSIQTGPLSSLCHIVVATRGTRQRRRCRGAHDICHVPGCYCAHRIYR
jgi:hypothetical protein